jgi:hypothetical protein
VFLFTAFGDTLSNEASPKKFLCRNEIQIADEIFIFENAVGIFLGSSCLNRPWRPIEL